MFVLVQPLFSPGQSDRQVCDLGNLPSRRGVLRAEGAIRVAGDAIVAESGLDVVIEKMILWHVGEVGAAYGADLPATRPHNNLAQLPARDIVAGPERSIGVA